MSKKKLFPANPETQTIEVTDPKAGNSTVIHVTPYDWTGAPHVVLHLITGGESGEGRLKQTLSQSAAISLAPLQAVRLIDALQKALGTLPESK